MTPSLQEELIKTIINTGMQRINGRYSTRNKFFEESTSSNYYLPGYKSNKKNNNV
jgi:hypothetical protein